MGIPMTGTIHLLATGVTIAGLRPCRIYRHWRQSSPTYSSGCTRGSIS